MQHSNHGKMSRILSQQFLLLVNCYAESVLGSQHLGFASATYQVHRLLSLLLSHLGHWRLFFSTF